MLFNSIPFALFFAFVLISYKVAPPKRRNSVLLASSLIFYSLWIPSYLILLLVDLWVNYALMRAMVVSERPKIFLAASITFTLGLLGYFKYAALFIETLSPLLSSGFGWSPEIPRIFLPLGISFYSFQIISLSIDTYRRNIEAVSSFSRYALFISFFPQLIAGPILRGSEFLGQLELGGAMSRERNRRGLWLIASGLVKKIVFADFLLAPFVDHIFSTPDIGSAPFHLIAAYSFAFQIYFDFSGYSDMARGMALLLGFEIPMNFLEPYLARNPSEFWRLWHITLSRWLRDYLFTLGGASRSRLRSARNLFLTMLLGGMWHGAAWTFALWGAYHGALLLLHRALVAPLSRLEPRGAFAKKLWHGLCVVVMFQLTCIGLIVFRSASFADAQDLYLSLFTSSYFEGWPVMQTTIVTLCIALHPIERRIRLALPGIHQSLATHTFGPLLEGLALGGIVAMALAASGSGGEFIYFQF